MRRYLFEIPESWEWCRLGSAVTLLGDGLHGTPKYDEKGEYHFINGNNLDNGNIIIKSSTKTVGLSEYEKYSKPLNSRTVLVSINGTLANVAFFNSERIILGKSACYFNVCEVVLIYFLLKTNLIQFYDFIFIKFYFSFDLGSVVFLGFLGFERIVYLRHLFLCLHFLYCFDFVGV